jgi:hypothetical protein
MVDGIPARVDTATVVIDASAPNGLEPGEIVD